MSDPDDPLRWGEYELKLREFHFKFYSEAQKLANEFSKLIVINLIWINAAGLGSLPVTASFIGIGSVPWAQKFPLVVKPGIAFGVGLCSALFCALMTYYNFTSIAKTADFQCAVETNALRANHPRIPEQFRTVAQCDLEHSARNVRSSELWVRFTYIAAHATGWASVICFLWACFLLIKITPPLT